MTNKLIPFDLECARKGDRCVSRNGFEAKLIFEDDSVGLSSYCKLWFAIKNTHGEWGLATTSIDGCYQTDGDSFYDLFMKPKTKKVYIRIDKKINEHGFYQCSNASLDMECLLQTLGCKIYEIEIEVDD